MASRFEKGKSIFFLFRGGYTVQDSQLKPKYYLTKNKAKEFAVCNNDEVVEYASVVRCKDCIYDRPDNLLCKHWCSRFLGSMEVREDDFCSYGRRKDGDN